MVFSLYRGGLWVKQKLASYISSSQQICQNTYDTETQGLRFLLLTSTALLTTMSLLFIYSSSSMKGIHLTGHSTMFLKKQLMITLVCWGYLAKCYFVSEKAWEKLPLLSYLVILVILAGVFIPGIYPEIGGAERWIRLGGVQFQPGEFAKLTLILIMAKILSRPGYRSDRFDQIVPILCFFAAYGFLLMLQPDFGTTVLIAAVCGVVLVLSGISKRLFIRIVMIGLIAAAALIAIAPYRWKRLTVFLDPWEQFHSGGFQIIQSYLGFQNGALLGNGLGESKQKLFFLPEAHTDFILAVIGEEIGFVGVMFVMLCYFAMIYAGFRISQKQQDEFWYYACLGVTLMISLQTLLNMGVVMGLLPTKGIPLPFISNGASSLVTYTLMISVLLVASRRYPEKREAQARQWHPPDKSHVLI